MPRFSIKDLLLAITLVAAGLAIQIILSGSGYQSMSVAVVRLYLFAHLCGFAMIGAGIGAVFHKKVFGAAFASLVVFGLFVLFAVTARMG